MSMYRMENIIQHYPWGSTDGFISRLLGLPKTDDEPEAELWMGAHPLAPSVLLTERGKLSLLEAVLHQPVEVLGPRAAEIFNGGFPFLFKVLSAGKPLSIQAHPDKARAEEGFREEEAAGKSGMAPDRNYKDKNHKPEILCALTPAVSMKGFRSMEETATLVKPLNVPAFNAFLSETSIREFFTSLLFMEAGDAEELVRSVLRRIDGLPVPEARVIKLLHEHYGYDPGILAPLFLNLVYLKPGEALYIPAGELHAYVEGSGMELMANSDNVLRGGLTPKYVDKDELLKVLVFQPGSPVPITPAFPLPYVREFRCEAKEIMLTEINLHSGMEWSAEKLRSAEIMFCAEGKGEAYNGQVKLSLKKGDSFVVFASSPVYTLAGDMMLYRASVARGILEY